MKDRSLIVHLAGFLLSATVSLSFAQATNVWTNVTPAGLDLTANGAYGTETVGTDPNRPSDMYANFNGHGIYKSTDFGATWRGPINTGVHGSDVTLDGNMTVASGGAGKPPTLYACNIHNSTGFWRSTDGGVNWQNFHITPADAHGYQDIYPPDVDPYAPRHIVVTGHEYTGIYESTDGGQTWSNMPFNPGMNSAGGTGFCFFINTGNAATTGKMVLWIDQNSTGTWRTTNGGTSWTKVDNNCHPHGGSQIYQAGNGVVYMAGNGSALGDGVLRSTDYGAHWIHVGARSAEDGVFGTPNNVYAMYGWACVPCSIAPAFQVAPQPGTTGWTSPATPAGMIGGGISQATVTFDGTHYIIVASMWSAGLWRYIEAAPSSGAANPVVSAVKPVSARANGIALTKTGVVVRSATRGFFDVKGRSIAVR